MNIQATQSTSIFLLQMSGTAKEASRNSWQERGVSQKLINLFTQNFPLSLFFAPYFPASKQENYREIC